MTFSEPHLSDRSVSFDPNGLRVHRNGSLGAHRLVISPLWVLVSPLVD